MINLILVTCTCMHARLHPYHPIPPIHPSIHACTYIQRYLLMFLCLWRQTSRRVECKQTNKRKAGRQAGTLLICICFFFSLCLTMVEYVCIYLCLRITMCYRFTSTFFSHSPSFLLHSPILVSCPTPTGIQVGFYRTPESTLLEITIHAKIWSSQCVDTCNLPIFPQF